MDNEDEVLNEYLNTANVENKKCSESDGNSNEVNETNSQNKTDTSFNVRNGQNRKDINF